MITSSQNIQPQARWLFELQDDGTVLYSSPRPVRGVAYPTAPLVGRNFFDEVIGFEDVSELRRRFQRFVRGRTAADSFSVTCVAGPEPARARIVMTRTFQPGYSSPEGMVMLEIKEDGGEF
jgi:hypothetical protein